MLVWGWLGPQTPAELSVPVRAYITVISLMVIFAYGTRGVGGSWLIPAGASLAAMRPGWTAYRLGMGFERLRGRPQPAGRGATRTGRRPRRPVGGSEPESA